MLSGEHGPQWVARPEESRWSPYRRRQQVPGEWSRAGCTECACTVERHTVKPIESSADRRGQYLGNGPAPHSVWVIPFDPAPWETGTAVPVLLHAGGPGRYFTDAWRARNDRR